jgi:hypothetical protein
MNAWLHDPAEFSRIVYDYADMPNVIEFLTGKRVDEVEAALTKMQDLLAKLDAARKHLLNVRNQLIAGGMDRNRAREMTKISARTEFPDTITPRLETLFGQGRAGHVYHYIMSSVKLGFAFKRSDLVDLVHMIYAYDCDLFRCDKAMAFIFRDFEPFKGKLVSRFSDLPFRIDELLK